MTEKTSKTQQLSLDELLINFGTKDNSSLSGKYKKLVIVMKWAYHLKNTEEWKDKPTSQIIEKALIDVFSGRVDQKKVDAAIEKDEAIKLERMEEKKRAKKTANE
ncbi:MAG: hypothetical protein ACP5IO_00445 [Elusimicrobiales bacterium]